MSQRGFTLLELLIVCLLLTAVTGAVAALAIPVRNAFDRTLGAADLSSGSRGALERMMSEVREAGSGAAVGVGRLTLADVTAAAVPLAGLDDPQAAAPGHALRIVRIGLTAPQGVLLQPITAGATVLPLDTTSRCANVGAACGFGPGMTAVIADTTRAVAFVVSDVGPGGLVHASVALPIGFGAGAVVAATTSSAYGLRPDVDGSQRLVRVSPGGMEQPVLHSVVDFEVRSEGRSAAPQPGNDGDPWPTYGPAPPAADEDDIRDAWGAGENCTMARDGDGRSIPRLAALAPTPEPVVLTTAMITDGPWCPDASDSARFDADLLRINAIEVRLRVEAASAVLRGPAGRLFRRAGTERNAARWVPDVETRWTVRMRNAGY
jgi:prepilin-type N-terminal cleavage/methylation domain-containing protein